MDEVTGLYERVISKNCVHYRVLYSERISFIIIWDTQESFQSNDVCVPVSEITQPTDF